MRVRNTVNHEFESQLERVEYVVTETYCGRTAVVVRKLCGAPS